VLIGDMGAGTQPNKNLGSKICIFAMANMNNRMAGVISDELRDEKPVICLSVSVILGASNFCCYVGNI
jgi:hypothetical protein